MEQFLGQRARSSPGVFQPGYIRVSAPKNSHCFETCNGLSGARRSACSPRAGPGTELTITWNRTPVLATSANVTAPFLSQLKGTGMLKVDFSTTGFRTKPWFEKFKEVKICPPSPCSTGSHPFHPAHSISLSFHCSQQPSCRLLGTPREGPSLLSSLRPGCIGCVFPFSSKPLILQALPL